MMSDRFAQLKQQILQCQFCQEQLENSANPVVQIHPNAKILIAGQAPGLKVHQTNVPFNDASGQRLRKWMNIEKSVFYDEQQIAILPMSFCYPGKASSGDKPPLKACAKQWRVKVLQNLNQIKLTLVIGMYAANWHQPEYANLSLTEQIKRCWQSPSKQLILPHPSPRNIAWFKRNPWFEQRHISYIAEQVKWALSS